MQRAAVLPPPVEPPRPLSSSRRRLRFAEDADSLEFRRYDYSDGWDLDDAALGWVDEEIVRSTRRLH